MINAQFNKPKQKTLWHSDLSDLFMNLSIFYIQILIKLDYIQLLSLVYKKIRSIKNGWNLFSQKSTEI